MADERRLHNAAADELAAEVASGMEQATGEEGGDLDALRNELEEARDVLLRSQAELDNYRKRAARQMEEERRYANVPLMRDLLPVLDNLQRAVAAADKTPDAAGLLEGVKMVAQQFEGVLDRHHCAKIEALNAPFDPHLHEAVLQQPTNQQSPNTVLSVVRTGFRVFDRVVRPSQVIVSSQDTQQE